MIVVYGRGAAGIEILCRDGLPDEANAPSKIRSLLGFQSQYGLEEGVRRTMQWYLEKQARQKGNR